MNSQYQDNQNQQQTNDLAKAMLSGFNPSSNKNNYYANNKMKNISIVYFFIFVLVVIGIINKENGFFILAANAEMYKCQTSRGIKYQQTPCSNASEAKDIQGNVVIIPEVSNENKPAPKSQENLGQNESSPINSIKHEESLESPIKNSSSTLDNILSENNKQEQILNQETSKEAFFKRIEETYLSILNGIGSKDGKISAGVMSNAETSEMKSDLTSILINQYGVSQKCIKQMDFLSRRVMYVMWVIIEYFDSKGTAAENESKRQVTTYINSLQEHINIAKKQGQGCEFEPIKKYLADFTEFYKHLPEKKEEMFTAIAKREEKEKIAREEERVKIEQEEKKNRQQEIALAQEAIKIQRIRMEKIKSGEKPIESVSDASIFYDADENYLRLVNSPPLSATGKNYFIAGKLKNFKNGILLFDASSNNYFALKTSSKTKGTPIGDLRLNSDYKAVGTHIGNLEYNTIIGQQKMMPVLEALYIE